MASQNCGNDRTHLQGKTVKLLQGSLNILRPGVRTRFAGRGQNTGQMLRAPISVGMCRQVVALLTFEPRSDPLLLTFEPRSDPLLLTFEPRSDPLLLTFEPRSDPLLLTFEPRSDPLFIST